MRLDIVLKYSGLVKRRTVAKFYCEHGFVMVNNKVGKPSTDVKTNDVITMRVGDREFSFIIDIRIEGKKVYLSYTKLDTEGVADA